MENDVVAGDPIQDIHVLRPDRDLQNAANLQPKADPLTAKLYEAALPGIVKIETEKARGTGFFVDKDGRVVTDAHCVQGAVEASVITEQGQRYRARVEKFDDIN